MPKSDKTNVKGHNAGTSGDLGYVENYKNEVDDAEPGTRSGRQGKGERVMNAGSLETVTNLVKRQLAGS